MSLKEKVETEVNAVEKEAENLEKATEREAHETYLASEILLKLVEGHHVTEEQIKFLKEQSFDCAKTLTIIGLQAVPGSSLAIIALGKIGEKHGFTIFPEAQNDPKL